MKKKVIALALGLAAGLMLGACRSMPEEGLAREAGLPYGLLCGSVNWGAGLADKALDFDEIQEVMKQVAGHMKSVIIPAIHALDK